MILRYSYDYTSYRAKYICTLIEKKMDGEWSQSILDILKDIAMNHKDPKIEKPNVTNSEDKEMRTFNMVFSNAINCVRGEAAQAIGHLLWEKKALFYQFKKTIDMLTMDENPAVRLASLFALWRVYNIDREWASEKIINLYESDYRLAGFHDSKNMLFLLYPRYHDQVLKIIWNCYESEDSDLIEMGAHCLCEMFILKGEFADVMKAVDNMSKGQAENVLHMAIIYFNKDEYNGLAKDIIGEFKISDLDLEMPLARVFYDCLIDLERDKEFLIDIMTTDMGRRTIHAFTHYLEVESKSVIDYKDIILAMSKHLISSEFNKNDNMRGVEDEISKLIIGLYDETSGSTQLNMTNIAKECLDVWDLFFEKQIGSVRMLSRRLMDR